MKLSLRRNSQQIKSATIAVTLVFCLALLLYVCWPPANNVSAQNAPSGKGMFTPDVATGGYIISEQNGQRVCQEATLAQTQQLHQPIAPSKLQVIYDGKTSRSEQSQTGLRITLRATAQLENFPNAKAAFIRAAQNWESRILSPISIVVDVDYGTTFFGEAYNDANVIGQTSSQTIGNSNGYSGIRAALIAGASSNAESTLYNSLPASPMPTDQGDVTSVFSASSVFRALGIISADANPDSEQQQLGAPPRIGFNSAFPFDFDPTNGISFNEIDFDGVATHEIGHALGFSSFVGEKELNSTAAARLTIFDFFRFRPGVTSNTFNSAQRILASGGTQVFFGGLSELGLSTGRPDATGGDRNQASHWKADEITGTYLGVMDPTASRGQRDQITNNDLHAFDTIGYRVRSAQQQIDVSPRSLEFGDVVLNASVERTLVVSNTGGQALQVTGLNINNAQFRLISPGTNFTVAANGQQNVVLRFTPTANGAQSATLTIASNDAARPTVSVALNGFGGIQPTIALSSGVAQTGTMPAPPVANDCRLDPTQFTIAVPPNASQLRVTLSGNQDIDLYARFNARVTGVSPDWDADFASDSPNNSESITITPSSSPVLRTGTYFVGITNCGPGAANYTLTATVTSGAASVTAVSAASFRGTELSSESIASLFGQNLASNTVVAQTNPLPTNLAGTTVRVRDSAGTERLAPLFFVSGLQINFLVPAGTVNGPATITSTNGSGATATGTINIVSVAPGLFSANADGQGVAAAVALRVRANGQQSFEAITRFDSTTNRFVAVPIDLGVATDQVFLILFGTGIRNRSSLAAVSALTGGTNAQVQFAGAQGSLVGLDQANILLPRSLAGRGDIDVSMAVDGKTTNTIRVNIK